MQLPFRIVHGNQTGIHTWQGRRGFTLIELLVVISIISLLISILLPALQSARTAASKSVSISNLRQITLTYHQYASDNKGSLVPREVQVTLGPPWNTTAKKTWNAMLPELGYLSDWKIYWSPARNTSKLALNQGYEGAGFTYANPWRAPGYGANPSITGPGESSLLNLGRSNVPPLSDALLLVECWYESTSLPYAIAGYYQVSPGTTGYGLFTYQGSVVRSYVDGHATGVDSRDLGWTPTDAYRGVWKAGSGNVAWESRPWFAKWYLSH